MSIRTKLLLIVASGFLVLGALIAVFYATNLVQLSEKSLIEKSRVFLEGAEAVRDEMARKLANGSIVSFEQMRAKGASQAEILDNVPILTAIRVAQASTVAGEFELRIPKIQPRNLENTPTVLEESVIHQFQNSDEKEIVRIEENQIRYFRPIHLTQECLLCHGDPAGSTDLVGGLKEGWKAGFVPGAFEVVASLAPTKAAIVSGLRNLALVALLVLCALGLVMALSIRSIVRPLGLFITEFHKAAQGDLTVRVHTKNRDEIGWLSKNLNEYLEQISLVFGRLKEIGFKNSSLSSQLIGHAQTTYKSLGTVEQSAQLVKDAMVRLDSQVAITRGVSKQIHEFFTGLSQQILELSNSITESSSAIEEISASITSIARSAAEKEEISLGLKGIANQGEQKMANARDLIGNAAQASRGIMDMVTTIQEMAGQTNLLAMNAAVEAAHAGESGKGFAVVAEEIRKLAEVSANAAKQIKASLELISENTQASHRAAQETGHLFSEMTASIETVVQGMQEMKAVMDQLTEGSQQTLEILGSLVSVTESVRMASGEMGEKMDQVDDAVNILQHASTKTVEDVDGMTSSIKEVLASARQVQAVGEAQQEHAYKLDSILSRFRLDSKE